MSARSFAFLLTSSLAVGLLAACTDAPNSLATAPVEPARSLAPRSLLADVSRTSGYGSDYVESFDIYKPEPISAADSTQYPALAYWLKPPAMWRPMDLGAALPSPTPSDTSYDAYSPFYSEVKSALTTWAIAKHDHDDWYDMRPMMAWHRMSDCAAPPLAHLVASYDESTYLCRNHMMTAVNARTYGVTYLTPNEMVDLSTGAATVRFDVATKRETKNDWIDLWITPYDDNLVTPLDEDLKNTDLQGQPRFGFHVRMNADNRTTSTFKAYVIYEHKAYPLPVASNLGYETFFGQSATARRRFELRLSGNNIKFGTPADAATNLNAGSKLTSDFWWVDAQLPFTPSQLHLDGAVVQIGHHSLGVAQAPGDSATTWHWDNIGVKPALPFTIINATRRYADQKNPSAVTFRGSAPSKAMLRFAGYGSNFEVRFNGAGKWQAAKRQDEQFDIDGRFHSYWTPVPAGTTSVEFRADNDPVDARLRTAKWMARDISIWSQTAP